MTRHIVTSPVVDVRETTDPSALKGKFETQLVKGEIFIVEEEKDGWCKGHCEHDGYVGHIESKHLSKKFAEATHVVTAARTHTYRDDSIKSPMIETLSFGSRVTVTETKEKFLKIEDGTWIHQKHITPIEPFDTDHVETAKKFMEVPYYWGGRSGFGIDCSGLIQVVLARAGVSVERDTEDQIDKIGTEAKKAEKGDIVFFEGHVGIMVDDENIIHANATHMKTCVEPLKIVSDRSNGITGIRRLNSKLNK